MCYNVEKCQIGECDMGKKIGLNVYGLSIVFGDGFIELHNIWGGKSLIDLIYDFASENQNKLSKDSKREAVFYFDRIEKEEICTIDGKREFTALYGRVKTGEYGIESELLDITTGSKYDRKATQADLLPFGFCIAVPEGEINKGIILLQTIGNSGMKTGLQRKIQECFEQLDTGFIPVWGQILPKAYIDRFFKEGVLQKIRMIRYEIPQDVSDKVGINYGVKQTREERVIVRPMGFLERKTRELSEWAAGQRSYTNIIEIDDFEYDDLKLEFKLGKLNKVISLNDTTGLKVNEDITQSVKMQGGNPEYDSLKMVMTESAREYLIGLGLLSVED